MSQTNTAETRVVGIEAPSSRRFWRWFLIGFACLGWLVAAGTGGALWLAIDQHEDYYDTTGGIYERFHSGDSAAEEKIAIIHVRGVIVDGSTVINQIERVRNDDDVKAVVLRVESPGGTVTGSDYIHHHLCKLRDERDLPIVVSMGNIAASGGYYVSMCVGEGENLIFAETTTITGSIGVVLPRYDLSQLMSEHGVLDDSIRSHPNKQMLSMTRSLDETQRQIVQAQIDESFERFKGIILEGRPEMRLSSDTATIDGRIQLLSRKHGTDVATGQVFTAAQALDHGLIDRVGFIEDAVERAAELAELEVEQTRVVRYAKPKPLIEIPDLIDISEKSAVLTLLSRPSHPQAWYLSGTMPPLMPWRDEHESFD